VVEAYGFKSDGSTHTTDRGMRVSFNGYADTIDVTTETVKFKARVQRPGKDTLDVYCTASGTWNGGYSTCKTVPLPLIRSDVPNLGPQPRVLAAFGRLYL
jgi:hypothetical protein